MSEKSLSVVQKILKVMPTTLRRFSSEVRRTGICVAPAHLHILGLLDERPYNLSELAEEQAVSLPTMSASISTLVEYGWVSRVRDLEDRRRVTIEMTPAGRATLATFRRKIRGYLAEQLSSLSPSECDQLLAGLNILSAAFGRGEDKRSRMEES